MYWLSTKKAKIIMLLPTLMIYAVFIIIPVFIACYYSFTDYSGLGKASFVGIKNYVAMFHDKLFLIALKNTFLVLLFSVIFLIVGSFMAALLMNKNFHGNAFFTMVIFAPYVIHQSAPCLPFFVAVPMDLASAHLTLHRQCR